MNSSSRTIMCENTTQKTTHHYLIKEQILIDNHSNLISKHNLLKKATHQHKTKQKSKLGLNKNKNHQNNRKQNKYKLTSPKKQKSMLGLNKKQKSPTLTKTKNQQ